MSERKPESVSGSSPLLPAPRTAAEIQEWFGCGPGRAAEIAALEAGEPGDVVALPDPFETAAARLRRPPPLPRSGEP